MRQQLAEQLDAAWGDGVLRRSTRATLRSRLPPLAVAGAPPTVLRGFVRQETLAETESSVVELAYDVALGREVVLKRLRLPSDADGGARLQREARVAGRLEHVGVLPVHGLLATTEVGPVVVLSHLRGSTWELAIERGGRSLRDHVEIAVAVARALAHAHADGVLHLDVKPANVLLGGYGEVCLTGWGEGGEDGVLPTVPVGTPAYAPLEVVRGAPCAQSDVYLLAGCLWHAATGRPPHDRTDVVAALLASGEAPEPPAALPGTLGALLARALSPVLAERPASVEAFATELQEFLRSLDSQRVTDDVRESLGPNARISALEESVQQLEAALSLWPSNLEARDLLADIRATLVHRFVQSGDLASAERVAGGADALPLAVRGDIERL
ncbi:MAG: serine/threonine protein kinase, partial [Myxococcales bacterium]|nr:serine/threonine protein kinase [Myxococcales bacterium]